MFSFGKPSIKKFANLLIKRIETNHGKTFVYDKESGSIVEAGEDIRLNLSNVYADYCELPKEDRDEFLDGVAKLIGTPPEDLPQDFSVARPHLRPKIWTRAMVENMALRQRAEGGNQIDLPLTPLGEHLVATVVFDGDHSMRTLNHSDLENWDVSFAEAMEIAKQNLSESTMAWGKAGDSLVFSSTGDNYDSSRILLMDQIGGMELPGDPIAIVPNRDTLAVAGLDDPNAVEMLLTMHQKTYQEEGRSLSPLPLRYQDGHWIDWVPPTNHRLRPLYDSSHNLFLTELYGEQRALMEEIQQFDPEVPFLASVMTLQKHESEPPVTMTVWSLGVDSLLPKTQLITFFDGDEVVASGEWGYVVSIVGDLLQREEGYYPERYYVFDFPTDQQLASIGNTLK